MAYKLLGSSELASDTSNVTLSNLSFDGHTIGVRYDLTASLAGASILTVTTNQGVSTSNYNFYGFGDVEANSFYDDNNTVLQTFYCSSTTLRMVGDLTIYTYGPDASGGNYTNERNVTIRNKYNSFGPDSLPNPSDEFYIYRNLTFQTPDSVTISIQKQQGTFAAGSKFTFYQITN